MSNFLKALVITLLGFSAIGVTTWGLLTKEINADGLTMAVVGLLGYVAVWVIGLYLIRPSSQS